MKDRRAHKVHADGGDVALSVRIVLRDARWASGPSLDVSTAGRAEELQEGKERMLYPPQNAAGGTTFLRLSRQ